MSSPGLPRMPWFPRDFRSSTALWPLVARAVYRELLDLSWDVGGLPANQSELAMAVRATPEEWARAWPYVEAKFPLDADGMRRNPRLEMHRADALQRRSNFEARASHAARARWGAREQGNAPSNAASTASGISQAMPSSTSTSTSTRTSTKNPESGVSSGDSRPQERTVRARPTYEHKEFHAQVVAVYHELVPELPGVRDWNERRRRKLNARISERKKAGKPADTVGYWRDLMGKVAASDWLMGRKGDWRCPGLEWLLESRNFGKLIEGGYDNHSAQRSASHGR